MAAQTLQLRPLGNTGLNLSSVGFGASPLGKVFGDVFEQDAFAAVREAFRLGVNFFDTSPYYGGTLSEKVLGEALQVLGAPRDEYIVSTKCGRYKEGSKFITGVGAGYKFGLGGFKQLTGWANLDQCKTATCLKLLKKQVLTVEGYMWPECVTVGVYLLENSNGG